MNAQTGACLSFDGTNDYVTVGNVLTASYTKEAWIKITNMSLNNNIISGSTTSGQNALMAGTANGNRLSAGHNGNWTAVMDATPLLVNTWYHVAVTYNAATTTMILYKNGVQVASNSAVPAYINGGTVTLGSYNITNSLFGGNMDEVRIWTNVRTQAQIAASMNCQLVGNEAGLKVYYNFNNGVAGGTNTGLTTLVDINVPVNNGTLVNFALTGATSNWILPSAVGVFATLASSTNVTCFGNNNGSATVAASGSAPFTYSWAPSGGSAATASGLAPGTYTCTVTNACSQTTTQTVTITQPVALSVTGSHVNVNCFGGNDGSATVNPAGGTLPYSFSWSPLGGNAATASSLVAGSYTCTITDANGCILTTPGILIAQPNPLFNSPTQLDNTCNGGTTGSASMSVSGGTLTYSYSWAPSGGNGSTASNLAAGSYTCTVTDAHSCVLTETYVITEPAAIGLAMSSTNANCSNPDGTASVVASGGTPGYTYSWAPSGGSSSTASALAAGTYTCTVTDASGCSNSNTVTVTSVGVPPTLSVVSNPSNGIVCSGNQATLTASGATSYSWTGGITNGVAFTPAATTTYTVTGTGPTGCTSQTSALITVNVCPSSPSTVPCGMTYNRKIQTVSATNVVGATAYRFTFYDINTSAQVAQYSQASRTLTLNNVAGLFYNTTYKWTVSVNMGSGFGVESSANCNITLGIPFSTVPCGVAFNNMGGYSAVAAPGGTGNYKFSFYNSSTNALIATRIQASNYIYFNTVVGLAYGNTYKWTVACEYPLAAGGNAFGPESNLNCLITFNAPVTTVPCGHNYTITNGYSVAPTVAGGIGYRFTFYNNSIQIGQRAQASNYIYFNTVVGLVNNQIDTWTVEVLYNNGVSNVYGPASTPCAISFGPNPVRMMNPNAEAETSDVSDKVSTMLVYPNPTSDKVTIETSSTVNTIYVYSITGELMKTASNTNEVSLADLSSGSYFIVVQTAEGLKRTLVIKE